MKLAAVVASLLLLWPLSAAAQQEGRRSYGGDAPFTLRDLPAGRLKSDLERLPPRIRAEALKRLNTLSFPAADLPLLRVDETGRAYYVDPAPADERGNLHPFARPNRETVDTPATTLPIDPARVFALHSRPGAARVVYINMQGYTVTGTAWNENSGVDVHPMLPYSEDDDPKSFTQAELDSIAQVWANVAEDLAPFDIDVTTEPPAAFGPTVGHVLVSSRIDANGEAIYTFPAGGVAYINVWGEKKYTYYQPALVFTNGLYDAKDIAEAASHEFGHNLSLSHDGTAETNYYKGHGEGATSWGPIMGVGYYTNVTQWSRGEYAFANNDQDDLARIAERLTLRPDDHGDGPATATGLVTAGGLVQGWTPQSDPFQEKSPANRGVIGTAGDLDLFFVDVDAAGTLDLAVTPAWIDDFTPLPLRNANLDVRLVLYRQADGDPGQLGPTVAFADPPDETGASVTAAVTPGRYYLSVEGVGTGDPLGEGYSDYASLGQYFIEGVVPDANPALITLTVAKSASGDGDGHITSSPAGIDCGNGGLACIAPFTAGTDVALTAVPLPGSSFLGWTGACTGTGPCVVNMVGNRSVEAVFDAKPYLLSVMLEGTATGTVRSTPAGIVCDSDGGETCWAEFLGSTRVTLTAASNPAKAVFTGWSGACTGKAPTCQVVVTKGASVTATFDVPEEHTVAVNRPGLGAGSVRSLPGGIACGNDCKGTFREGTNVTLVAKAKTGSVFAFWTGACSGRKASCRLQVGRDRNVGAVFNHTSGNRIVLRRTGSGKGRIVSTTPGLDCGPICVTHIRLPTRNLRLRAIAEPGSTFVRWSGPCASFGPKLTCLISTDTPVRVTAEFRRTTGGGATTAAVVD